MKMASRWGLALLTIFGGFAVAATLGGLVTASAGFWYLPGAGFGAAFSTVAVAYLAAPSHRFHAATLALILGAVAAWLLLEPSFYPESYGGRGAYQPTHLPIGATYLGGLVGLSASALIGRWKGTS